MVTLLHNAIYCIFIIARFNVFVNLFVDAE